MTFVALVALLLVVGPARAHGQEPRLPPASAVPVDAEVLIRRAQSLSATGQYRESAAAWQSVGAQEPVLADFAKREAIRAWLGAGDMKPVLAGITELGTTAPTDLLLRAADLCRSARNDDCATSLYTRARETAGRTIAADEAALGLAAALEQAGNPRAALETFRELQLTFRTAAAFETADAGARRLLARIGGEEALTEDGYDSMASRLAGVAAFRRAVEVRDAWLKAFPDTPRKAEIQAAVITNLYSLRANREARSRAADFLKAHGSSAHAHDVVITLFRLDVREGETAEVERRGRAIMSGAVTGTNLDDRQGAARLLAEYLTSIGQPAKALPVYDSLLKMTSARAERIDVLWRMAITSLRAGHRTRAVSELQQALRLKPGSETERAVSFWLGYALEAGEAKGAGRERWAVLARRAPFSYYGIRAASRLGLPSPSPTLTFPTLTLQDTVMAHPHYRAASVLSRAGLVGAAAIYARQLNAAFRRDEAVALLAARASEAAGDYTSSSTLMSSYFGPYLQEPASNLPDDFWLLAYPRAYWREISAAADRHGVDPLLMIGLSRQESHFDRTARSTVGAIGLFQIMPYTAAELDPAFANPAALEKLVQPEVSAELGAKHLASHLARYEGALPPTIASYNADRERVQIWWRAAKGLPEELFIDSIPYQQTRAYVRQVLTNHWMYQRSAQSASPRK